MNNIPFFTAAGGTATLILKEIPNCGAAYVLARTWPERHLQPLLREAAAFCRAAGARKVYGSAGQPVSGLEHAYDMVTMTLPLAQLKPPEIPVTLEAVNAGNLARYRQIYNTCFQDVPNAASYSMRDAERMAASERCYLALQDGQYAGMGQLDGSELRAVGVLPAFRGLGTPLTQTLLAMLPSSEATALVSTVNVRAWNMYMRLGFRQTELVSSWYVL